MENSEKHILELKTLLEKVHGKEFSLKEAESAYHKIVALCEAAKSLAAVKIRRQKLLVESPNGLIIKGMGNCPICKNSISNKDSWYDKFGSTCLIYHEAILKKIIPNSLVSDNENWYSTHELSEYFNFDSKFVRILVKDSVLKCRTILNLKGKVHMQLFLLKDNKAFLPPKKLLKSRTVKVLRNNEEYFSTEMWFEFLEEKTAKKLVKYSITAYLLESLSNPFKGSKGYFKLNPLFQPSDI